MRPLARYVFVVFVCLLPISSSAQQNHAAERLNAARALYYTPTASGLKTFHCSVSMDWKDMLTRFSGKDIPDDNPLLVYLNSVRLSTTDDLRGKGTLDWVETTPPPDALKSATGRMRDGLSQTLVGFFQSWNAFMNGTMVPTLDASTIVSQTSDGFKLHATSPMYAVDEAFDPNMLLTDVHVLSKDMDISMQPTYLDSPDGRIVSVLHTNSRQPPTAPPAEATMSVTYAKVSTFQIPALLNVEVTNVGGFAFNFAACTVETTHKP